MPDKEIKDSGATPQAVDPVNVNETDWCFVWAEQKNLPPGTNEKAALLKEAKWPQGSRISISFLDGNPALWEKVIVVAKEWICPGLANLIFDFRKDTTQTDIRISFRYAGSWSVLGTTCRTITDQTKPTMNFGWLTVNSADDEIRRVVLHEFGHALGLVHEHMNPDPAHPIKWNRDQVIRDLSGPPNKWSKDTIELNMFKAFDVRETNYTSLDPASIMMYPIPQKWTIDGFSAGLNSQLSAIDRSFIQGEYP